ncbi:hypothetical protein K440DRAFT_74976 [Wilcoxina mikolae CBS 423.85]|nr:hypothetical protein K440DRAFT_74976 [Wilcoxina mikolae CBS 423.85]
MTISFVWAGVSAQLLLFGIGEYGHVHICVFEGLKILRRGRVSQPVQCLIFSGRGGPGFINQREHCFFSQKPRIFLPPLLFTFSDFCEQTKLIMYWYLIFIRIAANADNIRKYLSQPYMGLKTHLTCNNHE